MSDAAGGHAAGGPDVALPSGVVTFLLTDVVGSTRLWEVAPHLMPATLDRHDQLMEAAVVANGGVLLKAKGEGDSTFSVFGRASDAIAAARDAQLALHAEPWPVETPIAVRMSVHTGEAVERHRDYFGRTVNRAARLRAIAGAAQVLVSQATAELVTDSLPPGCELVGLGVQTLRDLVRPEVVFLLSFATAPLPTTPATAATTTATTTTATATTATTTTPAATATEAAATPAPTPLAPPSHGAPAPESALEPTPEPSGTVPVPRRLLASHNERFSGRATELARLRAAFDRVAGGSCAVALVGGPPGIGKTGLATAAAIEAHERGAAVLLGRCDEDILVPYQPWVEALDHLITHLPVTAIRAIGARRLADLAGLVPAVSERLPGLPARQSADPETDRYLLFSAVVAALAEASAVQPIVLVLDDLHWADKPSLVLLRHVISSATPMRLQIVATYRDGEADASPQLAEFLAAMRRDPSVEWSLLSGLDDAEIVTMVERAAGHALDSAGIELARSLRRDTDGNPFFASELLRHLVESGQLVRDAGRQWVAAPGVREVGLPQSVRDVIGQRVARLGAEAQQVLRLASVIGREFDLEALSAISQRSDLELLDVLERAQAGTVLAEVRGSVGRYSFVHALIQQTLYEELGAVRRQLVHRELAVFLEQLRAAGADVQIAEIAQHWMAGGRAGDAAVMISTAVAAGDAAVAALAPDEAARWFADALRLLDQQRTPDVSTRTDLLVSLGTTQLHGGDRSLLEAARLAVAHGDDERLRLVEAALAAVGPHDSARRARLLKVYATDLAYARDNERCRRVYEEAVEMARRVGDPETLRDVLIRQFAGFWGPNSTDYRFGLSLEAVDLADRSGDRGASFWAWTDLFYVAIARGDRATFDRAAARIDELSEELGQQPALAWVITAMAGARALHAGDLGEAERLAHLAYEQAQSAGSRHAIALYAVQMGSMAHVRGDERGALAIHRAVIERAPQLDGNRAMLAAALLATGATDDARALLDTDIANGFPAPIDVYWLIASCLWAEVTVRLRRVDGAALLYERLRPWQSQVAYMWGTIGTSVHHHLGMLAAVLGDVDVALGHLAEARRVHEEMRMPFGIAWSELELSKVLSTEGPHRDDQRADELRRSAIAIAERHGFGLLLRDASVQRHTSST